jgi:hypothetical protein
VLVGLAVALLILWSAIELVIELFRSSGGKEVNITRYGLWLREVFHNGNGRDRLLTNAMLGPIERGDAATTAELIDRVRCAVDFRENPGCRLWGSIANWPPTPSSSLSWRKAFARICLQIASHLSCRRRGRSFRRDRPAIADGGSFGSTAVRRRAERTGTPDAAPPQPTL